MNHSTQNSMSTFDSTEHASSQVKSKSRESSFKVPRKWVYVSDVPATPRTQTSQT